MLTNNQSSQSNSKKEFVKGYAHQTFSIACARTIKARDNTI